MLRIYNTIKKIFIQVNCLYNDNLGIARNTSIGKHMETMVYLASDIQKALGLGRSKTYLFLDEVYRQQENPPFRVIKVGKLFRVPKKSFDDWINAVQ